MHSDSYSSHRDVLLLLNLLNISNLKIINIINSNLLDRLLFINQRNLASIEFLNENEKNRISDFIKNKSIEAYKHKLYALGISYSSILDRDYPNRLREIFNAPAILYYRGKDFENLDESIAIVGSRKYTGYGEMALERILSGLSNYKLKIVSGMAMGIDALAHKKAIDGKIPTVGILGSSLDIEYPTSNAKLYRDMKNELLISEFPIGSPPIKRNFVLRNRIISGLSKAVIIIEAKEKSGSLITARYAIEQNREVYAVPGNIDSIFSTGCNQLIKAGAKPITCAEDIVEDLAFIEEANRIKPVYLPDGLNDDERLILKNLENLSLSPEDLVGVTGFKIEKILAYISRLELKGLIESHAGRINLSFNTFDI